MKSLLKQYEKKTKSTKVKFNKIKNILIYKKDEKPSHIQDILKNNAEKEMRWLNPSRQRAKSKATY